MPAAIAYSQVMEPLSHDEIVRLSPPERLALIAQTGTVLKTTIFP
jgi:hypothetical protein